MKSIRADRAPYEAPLDASSILEEVVEKRVRLPHGNYTLLSYGGENILWKRILLGGTYE
ncbi:MAG: hypothetical protein QXW47_05650 [Candidatus Jordarchaeales archaeon]|nr:hypothetical protein [Candidatus Jordarchaeia archaeon]